MLEQRIATIDTDLIGQSTGRRTLFGQLGTLSEDLVTALSPEELITTLDGRHPVALLPVRIEARYTEPRSYASGSSPTSCTSTPTTLP